MPEQFTTFDRCSYTVKRLSYTTEQLRVLLKSQQGQLGSLGFEDRPFWLVVQWQLLSHLITLISSSEQCYFLFVLQSKHFLFLWHTVYHWLGLVVWNFPYSGCDIWVTPVYCHRHLTDMQWHCNNSNLGTAQEVGVKAARPTHLESITHRGGDIP